MRKVQHRLLMAAAIAAAGCQNKCSADCVFGTNPNQSAPALTAGAPISDPAACGGVEGLNLVLESVSGDGQSSPVGSLVLAGPTVQLLTALLRTPAANIPVDFAVTAGGGGFVGIGTLTPTFTINTDADGRVTLPNWRLGPQPGLNSITASVDGAPLNAAINGSPITFTATGTPPATLIIVAGNGQTGAAGGLLPVDPEVLVTDAAGRPVQNHTVNFVITGGAGRLTSAAPQITDYFGRAKVDWILGNGTGVNTLSATATGAGLTGNPAVFTANAIAGAAVTLSIQAGNLQSATVGTPVAVHPAVLLKDQLGNPVPGVQVTFAVASGGGSIQGPTQLTDPSGVATLSGWVLGATPGPNSLTATAAGTGIIGSPATFTATAVTPVPTQVVLFAGDGQTVVAGQPVPIQPAVRVTDATGAPVAGAAVLFLTVSAPPFVGGSLTGFNVLTNQNGVATLGSWTLSRTAGMNLIRATVAAANVAGDPVSFTATGVAGAPAIMAKFSGDNQMAFINGFVPALPTIRLTDVNLNPVAGVGVTFAVTGGGGTITGAAVATDAQGRATVGSWRLGPAAGPNTLSATAGAPNITGNPLTFTATGQVSPGAPPR